ncbi:protocadherin Fat 4-like [Physella acuta]|uniref:protocadherin Fat 4-like n=1 Tax=Physella acuta TaxID=109671 RepID=UPI0027DC7D45|nr:protocadherin Fat 4-like [Physella acuta]
MVTYEFQCGKPCCYKDCIMGSWGAWEACDARCESDGLKVRNRLVIQEPDCGGKRCDYESETTTCKGPCCPQDCVLGTWSDWSDCSTVCGEGIMTRTRYIKYPVCGGANCTELNDKQNQTCENYVNVDCLMGQWSDWTECKLNNGLCGEGTKSRQRSVLTDSKCRGQPCGNLTETSLCYGPCCKTDCKVGEWSEFGFCSAACGEGLKNRTRKILTAPDCGGTACPGVLESTSCVVRNTTDCKFTEWSVWSNCSTDCGFGKSVRSRTLLTPAYCGGHCLETKTEDIKDCESYAAKKDCQVGPWSSWGVCVRDCERGIQRSTRVITVQEVCGGVPCTGLYNLTQTRTCHEKCTQLCNQAKCSCNPGYNLDLDGFTCKKKSCGTAPTLSYCGPGTQVLVSCQPVHFSYCPSTLYGDKCNGTCSSGWVVKGDPKFIECQQDGTWTAPKIFCGPANKAPINISLNSTDVSELLLPGQCFGKLTTTSDNEAWDKHTYSVVADPAGVLKVNNDTLCVKTKLDYETSQYRQWTATIRATDLDGLYLDKNFTFNLQNNNDPPRSAKLSPDTLLENSPKGTFIGCFQLIDDDPGQNLTLFMLTNTKLFELFMQEQTYCLKVLAESSPNCTTVGGKLCAINYEAQSQIYTAIMVRDDAVPPASAYFDIGINVIDVNEPITGVTMTSDTVPENIPPGKPLLGLVATDEDKNATHKFEILDDPSGLFQLINKTLVASVALDYEINPTIKYTIKVRGSDVGTPLTFAKTNITFGVSDVNEVPNSLQLTSANALLSYPPNQPQVKENIPAVVVGTLSAIDPDNGDAITFSVNNDKLRIINTKCTPMQPYQHNYCSGRLVNIGGFNFEEAAIVPVKITAQDKNLHSIKLDINIIVIDMDDVPTDILVNGDITSTINVPENSKGLLVAELKTVDEDLLDKQNYFLSGPAFNQFKIQGNMLFTSDTASLDFETAEPMQLTITSVSTGQTSTTVAKTFTVNITNINEAPTNIIFNGLSVPENSIEGTLVTAMSTEDPDNKIQTAFQQFTYELLDNAQDRFSIKGNNIYVKNSTKTCGLNVCNLDYEVQKDLTIVVKVTDNGSPPLSMNVSKIISLTDVNDAPYNIQLNTYQIYENKPKGTVIGTFSASDQDKNSVLTFTLLNQAQTFSVENSIQLVQLSSLDYEAQKVYYIQVQVTDNGNPVASCINTIQVEVLNVNEGPEFIGPEVLTVAEDSNLGALVGSVSVFDPDSNDSVEITLKEYKDVFVVGGNTISTKDGKGTFVTINLTTAKLLDYESKAEYSVDLKISDKQGLEIVHNVKISIENKNDPPTDILLNKLATPRVSVQENVLTTLASLTALDEDQNQSYTFRIINQPADHFIIVGNELRMLKPLDYETTSSVIITIEVSDSGIPSYKVQKVTTIDVVNVNEPPTTLVLSNNKVEENSGDGTIVGTLQPTDPDNKEGFTYNLLENAAGKFKIMGDKIVVISSEQCSLLHQKCSLNYEQQSVHTVRVMVTDNGFPKQSCTFELKIEVTDMNDAPYDLILSDNKVEETGNADSFIGNVSVSDEDISQLHTFVLKDNAGGMFKLKGQMLVKAVDDRLNISKLYSVIVQALDNGVPVKSVEQTFYISISGVSEAPQELAVIPLGKTIQSSPSVIIIAENSFINDGIATIQAEDRDLDQTIAFTLLVDDEGQFKLDKEVACSKSQMSSIICRTNLLLAKTVNFEKKNKYTIIFVATDSEKQQSAFTLVIEISDIEEPPTNIIFNSPSLSVWENSENIVVGKFSAEDEDKKNSHTFTLMNNKDNVFVITADGQLSVVSGAALDYEVKNSYNITVRVTDSSPSPNNFFEKIFTVAVLNVNEKPNSLKLSNNTIFEGSSVSTIIGDLLTEDPDNKILDLKTSLPQTFEYKLLDDADGRFELYQSTIKLTQKGAQCTVQWCGLDFETQKYHVILVQVTDSGTPSLSASFSTTIQVLDANDPPVLSDMSVTQLKENMTVGDVVAKLIATDQDAGQNLTFSIGDEGTHNFRVEGDKLVLAKPLDFETSSVASVEVIVTDSGVPSKSGRATFKFDVLNVGEPPLSINIESILGNQTLSFLLDQPVVAETTKAGSVIGQLLISDPDSQDDISAFVSGDILKSNKPNCTNRNTGTYCVATVLLGKPLDYETQSSFSVTVLAVDKYGLQLNKTFLVKVKDENDAPQTLLINKTAVDTIQVKENSQGVTIATLDAIDPDKNQTFIFTVIGSSQFTTAGNSLKVLPNATLDYETAKLLHVKIKVTDSGQPPLSLEKDITVEVLDQNEVPTGISLTRSKVSEDAVVGVEIGSFITTDPDNKGEMRQKFTYELVDNGNGIFGISNGSLVVKDAKLDYEVKASYIIKVKVTDNGSPPLSAQFDIEVQVMDANDAPTNLQLSAWTVSEAANIDTVVGNLSAQESDIGQTISFTIGNSTDSFTVKDMRLVVSGGLDFETAPRVNIEITATDNGTPTKSVVRMFTITVTDVNEPPIQMNFIASLASKFAIAENVPVKTVIGTIETYDPDNVDRATLEVTTLSSPVFKLDTAGATCAVKIVASMGSTFTICTQTVLLAQTVKYVANSPPLNLEVLAKDKGQLTIKNKWLFVVNDSNDAPYNISIAADKLEIPENQAIFKLGALDCADPDIGQNHAFQLLTYWEIFRVESGSLLTSYVPLDYEKQSVYTVAIKCVDDGEPAASFTKNFTVTVTDINEAPSDITLSNSEVPKTAKVGETVSFILVVDPDNAGTESPRQNHTCAVVKDETGSFKVGQDGKTLQINNKLPLNKTTIKITLKCSDNGQPSLFFVKDFDIFVSETVQVPKAISMKGPKTVAENTINVDVGTFSVINALTETEIFGFFIFFDVITIELQKEIFRIEENKLIIDSPLDFEKTPSVTINLTVSGVDTMMNEIELKGSFKIKVLDVNEPPQQINIYGGGQVAENSAPGTIIGDLNTVDPEPYQTYTYTLMSVAAGLDASQSLPELVTTFQIIGRTLKVGSNNTALNFEKVKTLSLVIQTVDSGTPPLGLNYTIRIIVTDVNDPPTDVSLSNNLIREDAHVGDLVGVLAVTDEDGPQNHSCLVNNLDAVPFTVENSLKLKVSRLGLDYEKQRTYVVEVTCQDDGKDGTHLRISKSLTVNVSNVNEPPYDIVLSRQDIDENNVIGQLVGEIMATDPDSQQVFISLEGETSNFEIKGNGSLTASAVFDFEKKSFYTINVKATDDGGLYSLITFVIQINDINERPTNIILSNNTVSENAKRGTIIGNIQALDPDRNQTYQYTITEAPPAEGNFVLIGNNLVVGRSELNFELSDKYKISITVTDSGQQSLTLDFDIRITNANDPPTQIVLHEPLIVTENSPLSTVVSDIFVVDEDKNQTHTCSVQESEAPFSIKRMENQRLQLITSAEVSYEKYSSYQLTIVCSDGEFEIEKVVEVAVENVNEPPVSIVLNGDVLSATSPVPYEVGTLDVTDDDKGQVHTFSIVGANSDLFEVQGTNQLFLAKSIPVYFLEQQNPALNITIIVADNGQPAMTCQQTLKLSIVDIDIEELKLPEITISQSVVPENATEGYVVGVIYDLNTTISASVTFNITSDNSSMFAIKNNKELVLTRNISTFYGNSAQVVIEATNRQTSVTKSRTITVVISRSDNCYDNGKTCHEAARCTQMSGTTYKCICSDDFEGDGFTCQQIDHCKLQTTGEQCLHGVCKDGINSFQCLCNEGYTGKLCEVSPTEEDPCQNNSCRNNAACKPTNDKKDYICVCGPGWTGKLCDSNIEDCTPTSCPGIETCVDGIMSFSCKCPADRIGHQCEFFVDSCQVGSCSAAEICVPKLNVKDRICTSSDKVYKQKLDCSNKNDTEQCKNQFITFVQENGHFPSKSSNISTTRTKREVVHVDLLDDFTSHFYPNSRVKRETSVQSKVIMYMLDYTKAEENIILVRFVVMDINYNPYTQVDILVALASTCSSIANSGQSETSFCPSILHDYNDYIAPPTSVRPTELTTQEVTTTKSTTATKTATDIFDPRSNAHHLLPAELWVYVWLCWMIAFIFRSGFL